MREEPLRFKKSRFSGANSNCVEVAHTFTWLRDSKNHDGLLLRGDARALVVAAKSDLFRT
jgi:hypothetical protein